MDNSPLGRLPPEIRLMIYKEVFFVDRNEICVYNGLGQAHPYRYLDGRSSLIDAVRLRGTCRLVREENHGLYFSTKHVVIDAVSYDEILNMWSPSQKAQHLKSSCADVANWAHWLGHPVLRPRSLTLNLGSAHAALLDWQSVEKAVCQFYREVPVHLSISAQPPDELVFFERRRRRFLRITFELGGRDRAVQAVNELLVWYDEKGKKDRPDELPSPEKFESTVTEIKRWLHDMPDR